MFIRACVKYTDNYYNNLRDVLDQSNKRYQIDL